ncbi:hypothetical protein BDV28DRAFT_129685 [Aspergillus coremiiformis]|uniref:Probable guanine deaminase n=1 Tax=Aspergillus coremiiformis TaxID=138285 RepID=A0A5N6ZCA2_9EURO|nr:hypothetical protein BDV28DRAFT_129685 [Aspergillus coremiiformis]
MTSTYIVFVGTFVHLPRSTSNALAIQQGALWVSTADGRIKGTDWTVVTEGDLRALLKEKSWIPEDAPRYKSGTRVKIVQAREEQNEFFFPGFIDTHIHAPQYPNNGLFGSTTLLDWLKEYTFPMEASFGSSLANIPSPRAYRVYNQVVSRTLANGTTFASYFATIHVSATNLLAALCKKRGQRALIGRVCMDNPNFSEPYYIDPSAKESIELNKEVISYIQSIDPQGTLIKPIITPRFALTCTPKAMQGLADLAAAYEPPLHIQTHISENTLEIDDVRSQFPAAKSYADVYDTYGLLTPRTILAHGVHLSPDEQDLIHHRGAKISHCPASNSALGSGICPVRKLLDKGITVGLGTDVSGGYSPSILEAVRQACLVSRLLRHVGTANETDDGKKLVLSVEEALYLATRGGAAVVNMEDDIGGFDVGMLWDAQLIHLGRFLPACKYDNGNSQVDVFGWETWQEKVHKWVWSGDDRNVKSVWVGGNLVYGKDDGDDGRRSGWWSWVLSAGVVGVGAVVAFRRMRL